MRDLLPEEARSRRALGRKLREQFALHGFDLVTPPAFEFAEVLERGLGALDPSEVLRFVEPESGQVAALRPDLTPQIARMIATRLCGRPVPYRLCYEGTVVRRRSGRARLARQIPQVGVELAGVPGPSGDVELVSVAAAALRAGGLADFAFDLGDAGIVRALLDGASPEHAAQVSAALARKDERELEDALIAAGPRVDPASASALRGVLALHGGPEVLVEGAKLLAGTHALPALARLRSLYEGVLKAVPALTLDLAEVRGFAYYTGPIFHAYAPGPGEAIASGGRYDELLARFGAPMPAVGFAIDLDRLASALRAAGVPAADEERVVVTGGSAEARQARARALRARGVTAMAWERQDDAAAWARAWGFSRVDDLGDVNAGGE